MRFYFAIIAALLPSFASAAITNLKISPTHTQAIFRYVAPDTSTCSLRVADMNLPVFISTATGSGSVLTIDTRGLLHGFKIGDSIYIDGTGVSGWDGWQVVASTPSDISFTITNSTSGLANKGIVGKLVNDVNTTLFPGSDIDSREKNIYSGRERNFILGKRDSGLSNGRRYSRALQVDSDHRFELTCGADSYSGSFKTANHPLGLLSQERLRPLDGQPGMSPWPDLERGSIWQTSTGGYLDRHVDPYTGQMCTNISPPYQYTTHSVTVSSTNASVISSGWTNSTNTLTSDGNLATYSGSTSDVLCVRPHNNTIGSANQGTKAHTPYDYNSLESVVTSVRGSGAGATQADREIEVALSADGCVTPYTDWKTVGLPLSLATTNYPMGVPKAGFGDWVEVSTKPIGKLQFGVHNGFANVDGTSVTWKVDPAYQNTSMFNMEWKAGSNIKLYSTCTGNGTNYAIAEVESPRRIVLQDSALTASTTNFCASNFGIMLRKKNTSTDQIAVDYVNYSNITSRILQPDASGSPRRFSEKTVLDAYGNEGYLSYMPSEVCCTAIHWVSKDTGESRYVMEIVNTLPGKAGAGGWVGGPCNATEATYGASDPTSFTCIMTGNDVSKVLVRYKIHWDGPTRFLSRPAGSSTFSTCVSTNPASPNPCLEGTSLTGDYDLQVLISSRTNGAYDTSRYGCGLRGVQGDWAILNCNRSQQDTNSWIAAYDMSKDINNYVYSDQTTNPIVGAVNTSNENLGGFGVLHTGWVVSGSNRYVAFNPKYGRKNNAGTNLSGEGPLAMQVVGDAVITNSTFTCPTNNWNYVNCSSVTVTSEPFDPDPGPTDTGVPGEYGNIFPGMGAVIHYCSIGAQTLPSGDTWNCGSYPKQEIVRILSRSGSAPNIELVIARAVASGQSIQTHTAGARLYSLLLTNYNTNPIDTNVVWDVISDPLGQTSTGLQYTRAQVSHSAMSIIGMAGYAYGLTGAGISVWSPITPEAVSQFPQKTYALNWPKQFGKTGLRYPNTVQNYISANQADVQNDLVRNQFVIDPRPWFNTPLDTYRYLFTKVPGSSYLYKYDRTANGQFEWPRFKHMPMYAFAGRYPLKEKSGPNVTLDDSQADNWKFCQAYNANECQSGSRYGDVYINTKYADITDTVFTSSYTCYGTGNLMLDSDICFGKQDTVSDGPIQMFAGYSPTFGAGRHYRKFGFGLSDRKAAMPNTKVFPDGKWLMYPNFWANEMKRIMRLAKLPPIPADDNKNRTTFVPVYLKSGSAPAGTSIAQIEYGYSDFGGKDDLYCTERQESCLAMTDTIIGDTDDAFFEYNGVTFAGVAETTVTFPSPHKLTSDVRVTAYYLYPTWDISILSPTQIILTGIPLSQTSGASRIRAIQVDSPFAFLGDTVSVSTASSSSPIEIYTTTRHKYSTGARVCVSGVTGITNANTCGKVTVTGPSTFTLDGTTSNGSYSSGGTVVPGGVPCSSGCTVAVPTMSRRIMYYRWRYLDASGNLIKTSKVMAMTTP